MSNVGNMKPNQPKNRLQGSLPKIGIRPTIDGRRRGVRESLENQTMNMAKSAAKFLSENLRHCEWSAGGMCNCRHLYRRRRRSRPNCGEICPGRGRFIIDGHPMLVLRF